jgi:hypothetical protein
MSEFASALAAFSLYKVAVILSGTAFAYMGYKLFALASPGGRSEVTASLPKSTISIKNLAQGTFFALFGACLVGVTVWKGMHIEEFRNSERPRIEQTDNSSGRIRAELASGTTPEFRSEGTPQQDSPAEPERGFVITCRSASVPLWSAQGSTPSAPGGRSGNVRKKAYYPGSLVKPPAAVSARTDVASPQLSSQKEDATRVPTPH